MAIEGVPIFIFAIFLVISWFTYWTISYIFIILPEFLIRISNIVLPTRKVELRAKIAYYAAFLLNIRFFISMMFWCITNSSAWAAMFVYRPNTPSFTVILNIFISLNIVSIAFFVEKVILQGFALTFHKLAYKEVNYLIEFFR